MNNIWKLFNLKLFAKVNKPIPLAKNVMTSNGRLSLAELKAKADQSNVVENLEAIQGGSLFNCHGNWGARGKAAGKWITGRIDKAIESAL
jgi:hypothetical protein